MKLLLIGGARPNFMKIAPLVHELIRRFGKPIDEPQCRQIDWKLIHTGQHYDYEMSKVFFEEFDLPEVDYFLNTGSWSHAEQTAKIMIEFEKVCLKECPDIAVVVGDVNSTLACSITAKKLGIKVAHVEAGLRSGDMAMPEEVNRIVTDSISDYLFVTEKSGVENLKREGRRTAEIFFVGNSMVDTLHYCLRKLDNAALNKPVSEPYAVITLHRPSNVDDKHTLEGILSALKEISLDMKIFFPMHPRTEKNIKRFGLLDMIKDADVSVMPPQSYMNFLSLWKGASLVFTDSGGLQEETTALGIPCFTIRENTERPVTINEGTNTLVGTKREKILNAYSLFKTGVRKTGRIPELWDGRAAKRIIDIILNCED